MKCVIRMLAAPAVAILSLFVTACALVLNRSAYVFGLLSGVCGLLGIAILLTGTTAKGIIVLIFAFLISPLGFPMLIAWLLGRIQTFRYFIQDKAFR